MKEKFLQSHSVEQTQGWSKDLALCLKGGEILCLDGDLGSGKTTFVKGLAQGLKISPRKVNSPTFVLMNMYHGRLSLYHFDFYRLEQMKDVAAIGCEEFLYGQGVAVIEWASRFQALMPGERLQIEFKVAGPENRKIHIQACGRKYEKILEEWQNQSKGFIK